MASVTASEVAKAQDGNLRAARGELYSREAVLNGRWRRSALERAAIEGDSPVRGAAAQRAGLQRVGLFCIAAPSGR